MRKCDEIKDEIKDNAKFRISLLFRRAALIWMTNNFWLSLPFLLLQWYARICFAFTFISIPDAYVWTDVHWMDDTYIKRIPIESTLIEGIRVETIWIDDVYWYAWYDIPVRQQSSEKLCAETSLGKIRCDGALGGGKKQQNKIQLWSSQRNYPTPRGFWSTIDEVNTYKSKQILL